MLFPRPTIAIVAAALALVAGGRVRAESLAERLAAEDPRSLAAAAVGSGDAVRGAVVFHTAHLTCTKCHAAGAGESPLGPNLAGPRVGSDGPLSGAALTEHLVQSLLEPSKSIRPEYRAVTVLTTEGRSVSGLIARATAETVVLRDAAAGGKEIEIAGDDIDERTNLATSLMPAGLVNLLADRQQFLDLVKYLDEIARGGDDRAAALRPDPTLLAATGPADYERTIDHAGLIADWADATKAAEAFKRGEAIYGRVCANCHGTHAAPGSLPTALRFAEGKFKAGADPHAMYRTLTSGTGQMVAQSWMVPSQKYDVIHYLREAYLKDRNPSFYTAITADYLAGLPKGSSRGPEPSNIEPWRLHDYGTFLGAGIEVGGDGTNVARKGLAVRLDPGPGGIGRGGAWILYELDTLRAAAIWTGDGFIDWRGINFDGSHGTHPRVVGSVLAQTPALAGWADPVTGSFADPRPVGRDGKPYGPLPRSHARFRALHHAGDAVVLDYTVGDTRILESARLESRPGESSPSSNPLVTRIWSVAPHDRDLAVRVAAVGQGKTQTAAAIVGGPSATNDFHGWMDDVYRTNALIQGQPLRYSWTPHFNHRLAPEVAVTMPLWLDHFLKGGPALPETPLATLDLKAADGTPRLTVQPDGRWPAARCNIFYSVDPDPRARFWRSADVVRKGDSFTAALPLGSTGRPLFAFANVYHSLPEPVSMRLLPGNGDLVREVCLSSEIRSAAPAELAAAGVREQAVAVRAGNPSGSLLVDDFSRGWRDWYRLNVGNPVHWENWTRKITDPAWRGPDGASLAITLTMPKTNRLTVVVVENEWRGERGRRRTFTCTRDVPGSAEPQTLRLTPADFVPTDEKLGPLTSWEQLDVLGLRGFHPDEKPAQPPGWDGPLPEFKRIEWAAVQGVE
jgi:putative heme-binding domain-containing protein